MKLLTSVPQKFSFEVIQGHPGSKILKNINFRSSLKFVKLYLKTKLLTLALQKFNFEIPQGH